MGKAFICSSYLGPPQPERLTTDAHPVRTAFELKGGPFNARGLPAHTYEDGLSERTIIIEFANIEQMMAAYESSTYQTARKLLGPEVRDVRIVEQAN